MVSPIAFLLETRDELKKVVWPGQQQIIRYTILVIVVSVAVGLFIGGLDVVLTKLFETLIK